MKDFKSSSDLAPTPYNTRANRKLYRAIVTAVTPAADGYGSATILGTLRLGCPVGNGLRAWYLLRLHLELGETGPAAYQAQMNELRFKKKSGLEQYLINFERLRTLSGATDATAVLALIMAINECGDADVKQHFEWARSAPGMSYDYTNIVKQLLAWCTR